MTRLVDSAIAVKGAVESGLARELAVTLVHAPHFESKVGIQYAGRGFVNSWYLCSSYQLELHYPS